jgi:hypothetical protein
MKTGAGRSFTGIQQKANGRLRARLKWKIGKPLGGKIAPRGTAPNWVLTGKAQRRKKRGAGGSFWDPELARVLNACSTGG